jgi:predicted permease
MQVLSTIIPIFAVVMLGWLARKKGFMPQAFLEPANRLVYYLAIPAMIFHAVSKASFRTEFNATVLLITLSAVVLAYSGAWAVGRLTRWPAHRVGSFIQCAAHGNQGYIGLPVAFYFIGDGGFVKASIIAGFMMILQNILSVLALQAYAESGDGSGIRLRLVAEKLIRNPVIVSALAGVAVSLSELTLPPIISRFLEVLGDLAPPMSLLLIGASLSLNAVRKMLLPVLGAVAIKISLLPCAGLALFMLFSVDAADYVPSMILLAAPTATVAYVMSKQLGGDELFASAAVSASTIFSALTYLVWLSVVGGG